MKENKIICDKCGEKCGYHFREIKYRTAPPLMSSTGDESRDVTFDLCEECMRTFHETIKLFIEKK